MTATLLTALMIAAEGGQPPPPATQTVEVTGEAAATGDDSSAMADAKERAREDALREAVSQVAGTLITGDTLVEGNVMVQDKITSHASGYVKKWSYVGDPQIDGRSVKVKVRAEVGTAALDKDLEAIKALLTRKDKPRVVILVAEQNVGMAAPFAWWSKGQKEAKGGLAAVDLGTFENTFIDTIKNNGWTFVDHDAIEGKLKTHSAFSSDLSTPQVIEFGKLSGAEVAIVGRVVAQSPGQSELAPGMFAANANISLRAINCDNGEILDTESLNVGDITTLDASAQNAGQKALRLAAAQTAKKVQQRILERWQGELGGTARVTMHVTGISSYRALQDFEGAVGSAHGVRGVTERRADGADADLDLDLMGSPKSLARQLDGKSIKGKTVNVKKVSANELFVQLGK